MCGAYRHLIVYDDCFIDKTFKFNISDTENLDFGLIIIITIIHRIMYIGVISLNSFGSIVRNIRISVHIRLVINHIRSHDKRKCISLCLVKKIKKLLVLNDF